MQAVVCNEYGSPSVLEYTSIPRPAPKSNQLLVKVHATSVNPLDWKIRQGKMKFITGKKFPLLLGFDVAGEVVAVGDEVTQFHVGDEIYTYLGGFSGGGYGEYAVVTETAACLKPKNLSYLEAGVVPLVALTALQALRDQGNIQPRNEVLINGSSGGVGTFAVQLAKIFSAQVTAVCSTKNIDFVKSLGANRVIDYQRQDISQDIGQYDIIFDTVSKLSFAQCSPLLKPQGRYLATLPKPKLILQSIVTGLLPGKKAKLIAVQPSGEDLAFLKDLIEVNQLKIAIAQTYPLSEVAQAHTVSEQGHVVGKLAIAL